MILHVINLFHSSLHCPLAVLYKFLEYYSTFDWKHYCIAINGLVLLSSLPSIEVVSLHNCDGLLLTEEFLRSSRDALLPSTGVVGTKNSVFQVKFLNILDPLKDDNNLGRSVSKGNFYRIKSALSYGAERLSDILMLPPEKIGAGLEKFFNNTLERNGKGKRADVLGPVPLYSSARTKNDNNDLLTGIQYGMWFDAYDMSYPVWPTTSAPSPMWNYGWGEVGQNIQYEQYAYCYAEESPTSSFDIPRREYSTASTRELQLNNRTFEEMRRPRGMVSSFDNTGVTWRNNPRAICQNNAVSFEEKCRSRGTASSVNCRGGPQMNNATSVEGKWKSWETYAYIPPYERPMQEILTFEDDGVEQESRKEHENKKEEECKNLDSQSCTPIKLNISSDVGESSCAVNYSMDEFPLLPGSKPIPIRPPPLAYVKRDQVKETSESLDSTEFGSCKLSPTSMSLSEAGKQSDSDGSVYLDALNEPTDAVAILKDKDSLESQEKMVAPVQPLQLTDESEFPPLSRPEKPAITLCKKEFPPLSACLRSQKKSKGKR